VVGSRVVCRDRRRGTDRDQAGVTLKFGVPPASMPDWLALVGDSADGIPGIPGWGEKSAGAVLARYGHLEAIPDEASSGGVRGAVSSRRCAARSGPKASSTGCRGGGGSSRVRR
jgi:5'-3' exonuclease